MKSLILVGAVILGLGAARTVLNSPQLLPATFWENVPSVKWLGHLTDQDIAEINDRDGRSSPQRPKYSPRNHVQNADQAEGAAALLKCSLVKFLEEKQDVAPGSGSFDADIDDADEDAAPSAQPGKVSREIRVIVDGNSRHGNRLLTLAQAPDTAPEAPVDPVQPPVPPALAAVPAPAAANPSEPRSPKTTARAKQYMRAQPGSPFYMSFNTSGGASTSLVIRSSETDAKNISAVEEDLNIMSSILAKAAEARDNNSQKAMGIRLFSFEDGLKNLHIDGYGDIFLLKVSFPLAGPPDETAATEPKEQTNSTWETAKRELYGPRGGTPFEDWQAETIVKPRESYNPKRVEKLKDSLVEALKNAANIRSLKDDEVVTVVVTSGESGPDTYVRKAMVDAGMVAGGGGGGGGQVEHGKPANHQKSTLTLRAKKSDIDAFARDKTNLDAFRKKVAIALY
jgi:hypothetical protein